MVKHGSINKAGKVKGQTPKVEKKPKKKALTGRAKKRKLYKKRFLDVPPGGKRKGPNAQKIPA
jgi:small subunit ribosomal protein S30e